MLRGSNSEKDVSIKLFFILKGLMRLGRPADGFVGQI
jgi:hypothetical protein